MQRPTRPPSDWERERFGGYAEVLLTAIPVALQKAHERAVASYEAGGLETHDDYGTVWLKAHEELMRYVLDAVPGAGKFHPERARYELPVVNDVVLYPWRYARNSRPLERAKFPEPVGAFRQAARSVDAQVRMRYQQMTTDELNVKDQDAFRKEQDELEAARSELSLPDTVFIAYTSHPRDGLLLRYWADVVSVGKKGLVEWGDSEALPPPDPDYQLSGRGTPPTPPPPPPGTGGRFDAGELEDPDLTVEPGTSQPGEEGGATPPGTGSDDQPR